MKFWHVAVIAFLLPYCAVAEDARQRSITVSGLEGRSLLPILQNSPLT